MSLLRIGVCLIAVGLAWIGLGLGLRLVPLDLSSTLLAAVGVASFAACFWPSPRRRSPR